MNKVARWLPVLALPALVVIPAAIVSGGPVQAATPSLQFSHEVVVDEQRDGFEPDIQVAPNGTYYTSVPNGSSTSLSFIWTSTDGGQTFHIVPGNLAATGRLINCPQGGGDTEETLDPKGDLFFSDLQNLTNLTNSVSTDAGSQFSSNCAGADNTPVDRMWYGVQGSLGDPNFRIYEEYDAVDSSTNVGNQLVLEASNNGLTFAPVINPAATSTPGCIGGGLLNCVTGNEGISGNMVVEPNGHVLMVHTSSDGSLAVATTGVISGTYPALTGTYTNVVLNSSLCPDLAVTTQNVGKSEVCGATNFVTVAEDLSGNYYAAFASQRQTIENIGGSPTLVPSGPYEVYVVSSADGLHWSAPVQISHTGSNAFAWITAGSDGRVALAWYSTNETHEVPGAASFSQSILNQLGGVDPNGYAFDELTHAEFNIDVAQSLNALAPTPTYTVTTASEHPVKYGPICTFGTICEVTQGDRSLGDFLEIKYDQTGALVLSYVDDTSGYYATGPTGAVADNGPPVVIRQVGGPSLLAADPTVTGAGTGPSQVMNSVTDPTGDSFYSANGSLTAAGTNLDLTGASLSRDATGLVATMKVKSLSSLTPNPLAGGTTGEWVMRFTTYDPGQPGNGHIYYAAMQSILGQAPTFYAGQPTRTKELTSFSSSTTVPGSYDARTGTITIHVPFSVIGNHSKVGTPFYSATAFTATAVGTIAGSPLSQMNEVDATAPFGYVLAAAPAQVTTSTTTAGASSGATGSSTTVAPGAGAGTGTNGSGSGTGNSGSSAAAAASSGSSGGSGGPFANTGADVLMAVFIALAMLGVGSVLVLRARRRTASS
jgi:hypothetical protein